MPVRRERLSVEQFAHATEVESRIDAYTTESTGESSDMSV